MNAIARRVGTLLLATALIFLAGCAHRSEVSTNSASPQAVSAEASDPWALLDEAEDLIQVGDLDAALAKCEQALALSRARGDTAAEASTQNSLGIVHQEMGDAVEALAAYDTAISLARAASSKAGLAHALANRGSLLYELSEFELAHIDLQESLRIQEEIDDHTVMGLTLYGLGMVAYHTGQVDEGLTACVESYAYYEAAGDPDGQAAALNCQGLILAQQGRRNESIEAFEASLALLREFASSAVREAEVLNNMAMTYHNDGQFTRAILLYEESLNVMRNRAQSPQLIGRTLGNLALVQFQTGAYEQAIANSELSISTVAEIGDRYGMLLPYYVLGICCSRLGDYERAREELRAGLRIAEEIGIDYMAEVMRAEIDALE